MRLYEFKGAPNPRRVRMFMAEKGMDIPTEQVDMSRGEHMQPEFQAINPYCTVPVLMLDDGRALRESTAICRYLELQQPDPPLMGVAPWQQAEILMWDRHMEHDGFMAVAEAFRNAAPGFRNRALAGLRPVQQIQALAERGRMRYRWFLEDLDSRLADNEYICGSEFSIADITALVTVDFATRAIKIEPAQEMAHLRRWYEQVSARPSAVA